MVTELVAGLGIGFGIGYGLDSLFGTIPIFLVLFTLFGFAAGVKTMMQQSREAPKDWPAVILPILAVAGFVIFLIAVVA